ncbi:hypothetical protein QUB13_18265 [Microcoleus sp. B4-D4]
MSSKESAKNQCVINSVQLLTGHSEKDRLTRSLLDPQLLQEVPELGVLFSSVTFIDKIKLFLIV